MRISIVTRSLRRSKFPGQSSRMGNFFSEAFGGHSHYETFEYTVEKEFDGWEIRSYPDRVAAQTQIKSVDAESGEKKNNNGFMVLAKYIGVFRAPENKKAGGGDSEGVAMTTPVVMANSEPEPVAMTTPVVMNDAKDGQYETMQFILPKKYTKVEEAPVPNSDKVKLVSVPGKMVAAKSFSGRAQHVDMKKAYEELLPEVQKEGYEQCGTWEGHFFNPPYTLPWLRRNDIVIPVKKK